jgi:hypothetical protein
MSGAGTATTPSQPIRNKRARRAERLATVSHIFIGLVVTSEAVGLLFSEPGLLALSSLIAGAALVVAGIYELSYPSRHRRGAFLVQLAAGVEISIAAVEKFHQHKHYVQWVMLAAGILTMIAAFIKFLAAGRHQEH